MLIHTCDLPGSGGLTHIGLALGLCGVGAPQAVCYAFPVSWPAVPILWLLVCWRPPVEGLGLCVSVSAQFSDDVWVFCESGLKFPRFCVCNALSFMALQAHSHACTRVACVSSGEKSREQHDAAAAECDQTTVKCTAQYEDRHCLHTKTIASKQATKALVSLNTRALPRHGMSTAT